MSGLRGDLSSIRRFSESLKTLPFWAGREAARRSAPILTKLAQETFARSEDPNGVAWAPNVDGKTVTLRQSGTLAQFMVYVAVGTIMRVALGTKYAKYQIGKRHVFPAFGAVLPEAYRTALEDAANTAIKRELEATR
jgi:hypothetical protein